MASKNKGISSLVAILAIGVLALVGGLVYSYLTPGSVFDTGDETTTVWSTYESQEAGLLLQYPKNWSVRERSIKDPQTGAQSFSVNFSSPGEESAAWFLVLEGECNQQEPEDFSRLVDEPPFILNKIVCKNGFRLALNVREGDPQEGSYKETLNQMLSTLEFVE